MILKYIALASIAFLVVDAITLQDFNDKPRSRAKNFLIWQFLKQDGISATDAQKAFYQLENVNFDLFNMYAKLSDEESIKDTYKCLHLSPAELISNKKDDCVWMGITAHKVFNLPQNDKVKLHERFKNNKELYWLNIATESNISKNYEKYDPKEFLYYFNSAGAKNREENYDFTISNKYMNKLALASGFESAVKKIVTNDIFEKLQISMLDINSSSLNDQTNMFLALNALKRDKEYQAVKYLDVAQNVSTKRMHKDRAIFWKYLITEDNSLLDELSKSSDINIYSLYAKEKLNISVNNYFIKLEVDEKAKKYNIKDPFVWNDILKKIQSTPKEKLQELSKKYKNPELIPVQSYILERASDYNNHSFILPYQNAMKDFSKDKKAMMLSLMRQESAFIPSALSTSYALGLMQLMPFLVKAIDKNEKEKITDFFDMFDPDKNIAYANKHLDWLLKSLDHPLFVAYAYNGGMGYFTRHVKSTGAFSKGKYEPFFSMEMMANEESREYGKKVLANYVIYKEILGEKISIAHLFEKLMQPSLTDKFRK